MYLKISLWIIGIILILCWFGTLFETRGEDIFLDISKNDRFLGLSILLAGWLIAISQSSGHSKNQLAAHYVNFAKKIGVQEITLEQLEKEAGTEETAKLDGKGVYRTVSALSDAQQHALKTLIYEGKIRLRNDRYSLPKNS